MIASFFDGRIRLRAEALKDTQTLEDVAKLITAQDGVADVSTNPRTGSLLIQYDPAIISHEQLMDAAKMLEDQIAKSDCCCTTPRSARGKRLLTRKEETLLLGALYSLTFVSGFTFKRAHIAAGLLLTAASAAHLYARRKCL